MNLLRASAALFLASAVAALAAPASPDETRADFEAMAFALPYLALEPVLHGPAEEHAGTNFADETETADGILCRIADPAYQRDDLLALLTHGNPKVRALAAIALYERDEPSVLPRLAAMCSDQSPAFEGQCPRAPSLDNHEPARPKVVQTVGFFAEAMVNAYLRQAGFTLGVHPKSGPGFEEYWATHRERAYCAGWFAVQLDRAVHGNYLTPPSCVEAIRAVRRRIDAAPPDERAAVLLWLRGRPGSDALATDAEIVEAARALGRERLLKLLHGHGPTDDPDVRQGASGWMFQRVQRFVLEHAEDFLKPADADELLACGRQPDNSGIAADCVVAAARLRPDGAAAILHGAMDRFKDPQDSRQRALLAATMCALCGEAERTFALEWVYQASTDRGFELARMDFVERVGAGAHGREALAALVRDYRFGGVGGEALRKAARAVNAWNAEPVIAEDELKQPDWKTRDAWPEWVRKLRESIPRWIEEPAGDKGPLSGVRVMCVSTREHAADLRSAKGAAS